MSSVHVSSCVICPYRKYIYVVCHGVHVVCVWCASVVCRGVGMVCCGVHIVCAWCVVVCTCARGVHLWCVMVCARCASVVCRGVCMVCRGVHIVCAWCVVVCRRANF